MVASEWRVRYVYSTEDPSFGPDTTETDQTFQSAVEAGWISSYEPVPVASARELETALSAPSNEDLLILDLHGWVRDGERLRLATNRTDGIDAVPLISWPPAVILAGCTQLASKCEPGAWEHLRREVARRIRSPLALTANYDEASGLTHKYVALRLFKEALPGDAPTAFSAMERELYANSHGWFAELIEPEDEA